MSSNGPASTYDVAHKTLARRQYFREKQREHRRKLNADRAIAIAQCVHLQSVLDGLQAARPLSIAPREEIYGPLSWHSIAAEFKGEVHRVLTDRQSLVTQTEEFESLTRAMRRFVMNIPPPMSRSNEWRSATLVADPRARNLGKEWLTQQMYHNMHEPLALLPAVRNDEEFYQFDLEASDEDKSIVGLERIQFTWPGTVQMFRRLVETNMKAVVEEVTANTRLFHKTTPKGTFVNLLQGHFVEADRFIMVMRQIEHDEKYICHPLQKQQHDLLWTEVRQVSPTHILLRLVDRVSHIFRPATGFMSVDELAALGGIDVTGMEDDQKDAHVRREIIRRSYAGFLSWRQRFMDLMHQSAAN
ncbi:hypothetical protein DYB36_012073 [Aphanomyces astaci]|uniref:Uncharacterized protein n=1 Tax=Aphanomyces astaci TaxID=112090 RepID=A0A397BNY0_APHAT|nr:hypothetical protein DYB36_012073 [Aphanomyces astaci]